MHHDSENRQGNETLRPVCSRREALQFGGAAIAAAWLGGGRAHAGDSAEGRVMTVTGPVAPGELAATLPHEHVLVDFIGADRVSRDRYDADEVVRVVEPQLRRLRELGVKTLAECTPAYLGRDPQLLARLARATGMHLLTNTGYYAAAGGKYVPAHAHGESADQLAERWLDEWREGIEGTHVRPGFIKIGVDAGPLTEVGRKLVQAAARTHRQSGLTIAAHTGDGAAALEELKILAEEGVSPSAWMWVHAQIEQNFDLHVQAARQGAWVEFDGVSPESIERHVTLVRNMKRQGLLERVLVSQDAGWYAVGEPRGGTFRSYDTLLTQFVPALRAAGLGDDDVHRLTVAAPAEALAIGVRRA
jgi:phosphotriesterase-related protein